MYRPVLITAPATTPVTLAEAKAQLDIPSDETDNDALITGLINAAVGYLDGWTGVLGRCIVTQTWRQDFDCFERILRLPLFPVTSITSVKYDDDNDVEQTVGSSNYVLLTDDLGSYVKFLDTFSFPSIHTEAPAVRATYVAGHAATDHQYAVIRQIVFLLVRHWYDNPSAVVVGVNTQTMPMAVDALTAIVRRTRF